MDKWSYDELQEFIHEDIEEFMGDGLNIRQASSRIQVEYAKSIEDSELEKLIIYMVLCKEGVKHGFLRDDIKEETLELLGRIDLGLCDKQLSHLERHKLRVEIGRTVALIA
ncbi:Imm3 family immunity protein [Photobacterium sp. 2_MG-2023]|uniref:Imm3 family immunity protein n=1 Tax=Photobacterium TaxID=657 RepID=UPI0026E148FA|nr:MULTISPECIES: Imm3 family immunity protein [Photobacterium]MDO6582174.1 Imm3 family immunity protein [Photobacterium sp. 2_MG-2023]